MATYAELKDIKSTNGGLLDKVEVACWIAAVDVVTEDPTPANHAQRLKWASKVFDNPRGEAERMFPALLAQNNAAAVAAINGATDAAVLAAVNAVIDLFADQIA